jgi:TM2 domain-containing membrane protein YozV
MTTEQPPAGWYPDPSGKPGQMYWNGQGWNAGMPAPTPLAVPAAQPGTPYGGAAYGVDAHGRPLSDKSKRVAALLQLFLGMFGGGRFYLGYNKIGYLQGIVTGISAFTLGWIWPLIDVIMILTGNLPDAQGRTLRD